jgi:hypothetical protein
LTALRFFRAASMSLMCDAVSAISRSTFARRFSHELPSALSRETAVGSDE